MTEFTPGIRNDERFGNQHILNPDLRVKHLELLIRRGGLLVGRQKVPNGEESHLRILKAPIFGRLKLQIVAAIDVV
jgi:hypothetical protein